MFCIILLRQLKDKNKIISTGFFNAVQVYGSPLKNPVEKLIFSIMQIQVFKFKEQEVRTKIINGKEYFCASDVCKILDIQNGRDVVASLENGCVVKNDIPHPQSKNKTLQVSFVNEAGLYEIIFKSIKPEARLFRKWIFEEVLPQIRKTGGYNIEKISMKELAYKIIEIEEQKEQMQLQIDKQDKQIAYYDDILVGDDNFCLQNSARMLHLKPNKFIDRLKIMGYLQTKGLNVLPISQYVDQGLFSIKTIQYQGKNNLHNKPQVKMTTKGLAYFAKRVLDDFDDILNKPTEKKIFQKIKKNDKSEDILKLLNENYV